MRALVFKTVTFTTAYLITTCQWLGNTSAHLIGAVGYFLMRIVDSERLGVYEAVLEQGERESEEDAALPLAKQSLELRLLAGAQHIRDHAKESGDWTEEHSDAIAAIGETLLSEFDWEEDSVHQYLKEIVESIPGLEYEIED